MIAFELPGGFPIYLNALMLGAGASLGMAWSYQHSSMKLKQMVIFGGFWWLVGGLVGARVAFVGINWLFFLDHPAQIWQVHLGGLSAVGAITGGLIGVRLYTAIQHTSFLNLMDTLLPLFTTLVVFAWLGCWLDGSAYGVPTNSWWGLPALDEFRMITRRTPIQLLGAGGAILIFIVIEYLRISFKKTGVAAGIWSTANTLLFTLLSLERADPVPYWRGMRIDTWYAGLGLVASLLLIFISHLSTKLIQNRKPL